MSRLLYAILLVFLVIVSQPTFSAEHILTPMLGITSWSDTDGHTARGSEISFRDQNETTYGFRYLYLFDNKFAVGGNIYMHEMDVKTTGQANDAGVAHVHALAEYFFTLTDNVSFFVGAGLGFSGMGFSGGNLHEKGTGGKSFEINNGFLFRLTERVGLQLEYKYTSFDMDEDIDNQRTNIDTTSNSLLLGLTIHL